MRKIAIALALLATTLSSEAYACGGLIRDLIDPSCKPPPPMEWYKAGASGSEFAQTRYRCLQEAQQRIGTTLVLGENGGAMSSVVTNDQLFGACMNAKGWLLRGKR